MWAAEAGALQAGKVDEERGKQTVTINERLGEEYMTVVAWKKISRMQNNEK